MGFSYFYYFLLMCWSHCYFVVHYMHWVVFAFGFCEYFKIFFNIAHADTVDPGSFVLDY